jgi:ABC-type branched-subunit amino acid transport system substrate-binding protein
MSRHQPNTSSTVVLIACACMAWLLFSRPAPAQEGDTLSPQERRGKQIYLKGESAGGEIKAVLASDIELPATSFPCANCHGLKGEGASEGGLQPPPLGWETLTVAGQSALTRRPRAPYDESSLARAIRSGLSSSGAPLHPGMPRFRMTADQMADLIAYLKRLGKVTDHDAGLTGEAIKVGAALPLTGPLARIGEDVKLAIGAYFAEVNRQGGIYGRRFELTAADSRGDAAGTVEATRRLVEQEKVFALVGSFEPAASDAANEFLRQREVPLIGPVTLSPQEAAVPNPFVFYLLPSFADQSRALVDFIKLRSEGRAARRVAVVYGDNRLDRDALAGVEAQAKLHSMQVVSEQSYSPGRLAAAPLVRSLAEKAPDAIFFFGSGEDFVAFATEAERARLGADLFASAATVGRAVFNLPPALAAKTYLAYPASLPDRDDFGEFIALMRKAGVTLRSAAFQAVAYAAARIFVEAVKSSGRQLGRADVIRALEQFRDYATGVIAPVTFGLNRRIGATGSYVVQPDPARKTYVPVSDRINPHTAKP